jgi:CheY-like chemotaxis protein
VSIEQIGRSLRVLVVDDEPLIAMGISDMLEDLGHEAVSAYSGREALDLLADTKFDLVITDQTMPDMTGAALARDVIQRDPGLMIFLSTGHSAIDDETVRHLPRLNKPYALADLEALIAAKFGGS